MKLLRLLVWCALWPAFVVVFVVLCSLLDGLCAGALEGHERWRVGLVTLLRTR